MLAWLKRRSRCHLLHREPFAILGCPAVTQLTFDFSSDCDRSLPSALLAIDDAGRERAVTPRRRGAVRRPAPPVGERRSDQLQSIGELAQQVIARYDIVRRRREARLLREASRREMSRAKRVASLSGTHAKLALAGCGE